MLNRVSARTPSNIYDGELYNNSFRLKAVYNFSQLFTTFFKHLRNKLKGLSPFNEIEVIETKQCTLGIQEQTL